MAIERELQWRQYAENFEQEQKKILLALSSKKWLWRTFENLQAITKLDYNQLNQGLTELFEDKLIRGSYIRNTGTPIFGLTERVGDESIRTRGSKWFNKLRNR